MTVRDRAETEIIAMFEPLDSAVLEVRIILWNFLVFKPIYSLFVLASLVSAICNINFWGAGVRSYLP